MPFEDDSGRVYFRNAGLSHRNGLETAVLLSSGEFSARTSYTRLDARFDRYRRDGADFSGHRVPGIPLDRWAISVRYGRDTLLAGADVGWYGPTMVNDQNDERTDALLTTSAMGGYRFRVDAWQLTLEGRLQNVLDRRQYDNLRVNALGRRYYEPAAGFSAYTSFEISHAFSATGS